MMMVLAGQVRMRVIVVVVCTFFVGVRTMPMLVFSMDLWLRCVLFLFLFLRFSMARRTAFASRIGGIPTCRHRQRDDY